MYEFCCLFSFASLIKDHTCFKSVENPSCVDLILTNMQKSFQNSMVIETGLSDFHKLTLTVLKTSFRKKSPKVIQYREKSPKVIQYRKKSPKVIQYRKKSPKVIQYRKKSPKVIQYRKKSPKVIQYRKKSPKVIQYRNYKSFSHTKFLNELGCFLNKANLYNISNDDFVTTFLDILNKHAPLKQKYIRANDNPFVTKELRKEHMLRSRLRNKSYKDKTDDSALAYKKQKNKCVSQENLFWKFKSICYL